MTTPPGPLKLRLFGEQRKYITNEQFSQLRKYEASATNRRGSSASTRSSDSVVHGPPSRSSLLKAPSRSVSTPTLVGGTSSGGALPTQNGGSGGASSRPLGDGPSRPLEEEPPQIFHERNFQISNRLENDLRMAHKLQLYRNRLYQELLYMKHLNSRRQ